MPLRDVFSPHCSSPRTPMIAPLKTPLSSSWITQTTLQSSVSSRMATSLLKQTLDKRLSSWLSGAVLTTWSSTRSKQWSWSCTSGETPLISPHSPSSTAQWRHSGSWDHHLSGPEVGHSHRLHCKKRPYKDGTSFISWGSLTCRRSCWNSSTQLSSSFFCDSKLHVA